MEVGTKMNFNCLSAYVASIFFLEGGQLAHPRKFLGRGGVRMGAQTEKINKGGLGCANEF